jgi:hypothetical protein
MVHRVVHGLSHYKKERNYCSTNQQAKEVSRINKKQLDA